MKTRFVTHPAGAALALGLAVAALFNPSALAQSVPVFQNLWKVNAGAYYNLTTTGNNNRGVGWSPVSGNVLYAVMQGTPSSNHVAVLDGATGALLNALDGTGITGGTLALMSVRVAADGSVYAINLAGAGSTLKLYRWASETDTNPPVVVYQFAGVPVRVGDTMDLRGSGLDTQIVTAGSGTSNPGNQFVVLAPSDATLTNAWNATWLPYPAGLAAGALRDITFAGASNAVYGKVSGTPTVQHVGYDPVMLTTWVIGTLATDNRFVGIDFVETNGVKVLSGVCYGSGTGTTSPEHRVRIYNITTPASPVIVLDELLPGPYAANGNGIGSSEIRGGGRAAFVEPNNGIAFYNFQISEAVPPAIVSAPVGNANVLRGGWYVLSASATGTSPIGYQWWKDGSPVAGATTASLILTNVTTGDAGGYSVVASNAFGRATSAPPATVGVIPSAAGGVARTLWQKTPGTLFFLANDNRQRGLAYNPATGHVLVVSRTPTNGVHVLDAATGNYLWSLEMAGVGGYAGSTFDVNMIAVSEDGVVFVCSLTTGGGGFVLYRWDNDQPTTYPYAIWATDPGVGRVGDTLTAVGRGADIVLLAASRLGTKVAVFSGYGSLLGIVDVAEAPAEFAGLGLYATAPTEFWAKSTSHQLRKVVFDLDQGTNAIVATLNAGVGIVSAIAVDAPNQLVAGVSVAQTPDNVALYDVWNLTTTNDTPRVLDQDFFGADNPNINGTGQAALDFGAGRIWALNSNNGLLALKYAPPLRLMKYVNRWALWWAGSAVLQRASAVEGPYSDLIDISVPYILPDESPAFYRLRQ